MRSKIWIAAVVAILGMVSTAPAQVVYSVNTNQTAYTGTQGSSVQVTIYLTETLSGASQSIINNTNGAFGAGIYDFSLGITNGGGNATITGGALGAQGGPNLGTQSQNASNYGSFNTGNSTTGTSGWQGSNGSGNGTAFNPTLSNSTNGGFDLAFNTSQTAASNNFQLSNAAGNNVAASGNPNGKLGYVNNSAGAVAGNSAAIQWTAGTNAEPLSPTNGETLGTSGYNVNNYNSGTGLDSGNNLSGVVLLGTLNITIGSTATTYTLGAGFANSAAAADTAPTFLLADGSNIANTSKAANGTGDTYTGAFDPGSGSNFTFTVSPTVSTPEPGSLALCGLALSGLGFGAWRRRKSVTTETETATDAAV